MKSNRARLAMAGILMMVMVGCNGPYGREFIPLSPVEIEAARGVVFTVAGHRLNSLTSLPVEVTVPFNPVPKSRDREVRSKAGSDPVSGITSLFQAAVKAFPEPPKPKDMPPPSPTPAVKAEPFYGYCPICGAKGIKRTRDLNPVDTCALGHTYPSFQCQDKPTKAAVAKQNVVLAYLPKWFFCPPCVKCENDLDQVPTSKRDSLPVNFQKIPLKSEDELPREYRDAQLGLPLFVWTSADGKKWTHSGWTNLESFLETYDGSTSPEKFKAMQARQAQTVQPQSGSCGPNGCPAMRGGRKGRRVSMVPQGSHSKPTDIAQAMAAATSQGLPSEYVWMLLDAVGKEIPLTPQASIVMPATLGMKFTKVGDTLSLELSEPWPMLRYKTWGIRFDDFLKGATISPALAVVKLKSYGDVKFAVE